jgi:cysteine-rich repeat protein
MRSTFVLAVCALAACVDASSVTCPDGRVCPSSKVCATVNVATVPTTFCVDQSQLGCTSSERCGDASTCHDEVCFPDACNNYLVDFDETCDDGNNLSGDGCSTDCSSNETCGNEATDLVRGEQCDSGVDGLSNDGCTSTCQLEGYAWRDVTPLPIAGRFEHSMAFDLTRGQIILFGGNSQTTFFNETWAWTGSQWKQLIPGRSPSPRAQMQLVTDVQRQRIVSFGGINATYLGETWEWDGTTWIDRKPTVAPAARTWHAMAYDAVRHQTVLFGGFNGAETFADTWTWDGTTWTKRTPAASPPMSSGRFGSMVFDSVRGVVVFFNESTTWLWNGTNWAISSVAAVGGQCPWFDAMTFDAFRGVVVGRCGDKTFQWDGVTSAWQLYGGADIGDVFGTSLAYDPIKKLSILFGGSDFVTAIDGTWTFNGTWSQPLILTPTPDKRAQHAMTYRAATGEVVVFGGIDYTTATAFGDTWLFSGGAWTRFAPGSLGPARLDHVLDYDSVRDRVVLFGGVPNLDSAPPQLNDVWEWDGLTWTEKTPLSGSPPGGRYFASAFDVLRKELIVFGGYDSTSLTTFGETWGWNGSTWSHKTTPVAPSPRHGASMAYDVARGRIVLHGGAVVSNVPYADTWEWDGTSWTQFFPATSPGQRWRAPMSYDPDRQRVVLTYGKSQAGISEEVWEWDGKTWTQRPAEGTSGGRFTMVYSAVEHRMVTFSGSAFVGATADTWALQSRPAFDDVEACILGDIDEDGDGMMGCADPDCWAKCTPLCPPGVASCPAGPRCGDGVCSVLENSSLCGTDCH